MSATDKMTLCILLIMFVAYAAIVIASFRLNDLETKARVMEARLRAIETTLYGQAHEPRGHPNG